MNYIKIITNSPEDTIHLGEKIAKSLKKFPAFIGLNGELGTGKTILIKGIAKGLNISETITSPSFQIIKEYSAEKHSLIHIDLYRIENSKEILSFNNYLSDKKNSIIAVEWANKFQEIYPKNYLDISIFFTKNKNKREIKLICKGYLIKI